MYDELIKRLRDSEHEIDCSLCDRDCCYPDGKVHGKCIIIEAADAIEVLSKMEKATQWIPVTERCPEKSGDYLVFDDCGNLYVNEWHCLLKKWQYDDSRITHWQKLPEPPKEET